MKPDLYTLVNGILNKIFRNKYIEEIKINFYILW